MISTDRSDVVVCQTVSRSKDGELSSTKTIQAVRRPRPEISRVVAKQSQNNIARQSVAGGVNGEPAILQQIQAAAVSTNPQVALEVFEQGENGATCEWIAVIKTSEMTIVETTKSASRSDQKVSVSGRIQGENSIVWKTISGCINCEVAAAERGQATQRTKPQAAVPVLLDCPDTITDQSVADRVVCKRSILNPSDTVRRGNPKRTLGVFEQCLDAPTNQPLLRSEGRKFATFE